ncbi:hypothetical protein M3661_18530 [Paenibacillus sp. MER 180]|uniref:hypothetical protein n=1 Tax=Paenibacillus sp. MER 180 TaxID=2939570 RepID=UPI00203FDD70|nr:hypothetical protein [Paenibacillus sp. MER 180]MCM3292120.1 hypothetical protein [Paenibacillus sp. MER 180]
MFCSGKYVKILDIDSEYWDQLRVNHERIDELNTEKNLDKILFSMKPNERAELYKIFDINESSYEDAFFKDRIKEKNAVFPMEYFLYLREFINRKKKAVEHLYSVYFSDQPIQVETSDYLKLIQMFVHKPSFLFEILVSHEWKIKAGGELYQYDKVLPSKELEQLATNINYQGKLINVLFKSNGQSTDYRIFAHCILNKNEYIYMVYKKNKDTKRADYDRAKRIKDVDIILFRINPNEKIIEIKSSTKSEVYGIINYFSEQFNLRFTEIVSDVFCDYEPIQTVQVFNTGDAYSGIEPIDFTINKIVFNNSLLTKSPQVTIQLSKSDIWLSVVDAFRKNVISINSLADIEQIKITTNNHSRTIRSLTLENGHVVFKLDDSGIDEQIKQEISDKFKEKFGFPLNQPVNNKLAYGEALKIDYLFRISTDSNLSEELNEKFRYLVSEGFFQLEQRVSYECRNNLCGFQSELLEDFHDRKCPNCNEEYREQKYSEYKANEDKISETIVDCFSENPQLQLIGHNNMKIKGRDYVTYKYLFDDKPLQIMVSGTVLSKATISHIERLLIPTIIVYYGVDKEQASIYTPNTIELLDFGLLFLKKDAFEEILNPILGNLRERAFLHISTVASQAHVSLKDICGKTSELKDEYDADRFEDEVFSIFKDMISNSEKWGKEARGKRVPEGLIDIQYNKTEGINKHKYNMIFTYDCKLTKDTRGYDLDSEEKKKGVDYVKRLNNLSEVSTYCSTGQVSGHIFISNKFREKQIPNMISHFYEELGDKYTVRPIFIEVGELVYIYEIYCKNLDNIMKVPDIFYEQLSKLLKSGDEGKLTKDSIDECFDEVLVAATQYQKADTKRITRKLTK